MSVKRIVDVSFWENDNVIEEFTPEDMLFFLYLLTNTHSTQLGIYKIREKQIASEIKLPIQEIRMLLGKFQYKYGMIRYSKQTHEVAIKNYLCHSVIGGGKPVFDLLLKQTKDIKDKSLLKYIIDEASETDNQTVNNYFEYIKNNIDLDSIDIQNESQNQIQIQNQKSYHESYHESENDQNLSSYSQNSGLIPEFRGEQSTNRITYRGMDTDRIIPITSDYGKGEAK